MNLKFHKILVIATMLFLLGACAKSSAVELGENAPDLTLKDLNGNAVSLASFKGKVVILDFFASWCPPCKEEIPDFIELQKTYGMGSFSMVGVALVSLDEAKEFADKSGINYPVLIDDGKASTIYGPIRSIPTTFVIGKDSKIVKKYIGYRSREVFESDIKELLK